MNLSVQKREIFGKKTKALRKQGLIPAELYGHGAKNLHLSVPSVSFNHIFKEAGESTIVELKIEGSESPEEKFNVVVHDVQQDPLTDEINHIDFYQVKMDEKMKAKVVLGFVGEAPAVKEKGGILIKAVHEAEVEALPGDLPHTLQVDLTKLTDIGSSIHIRDIAVGPKVKILFDPETVIATVKEPVKEEETIKAETPEPTVATETQTEEGKISAQ